MSAARSPQRISPEGLGRVLPPGGLTYLQGCASVSPVFVDALTQAGDMFGDMRLTGIWVPGLNRRTGLAEGAATRAETFFMTPELAEAGDRVSLLPFNYAQIGRHFDAHPPQAAIFAVSPPDARGLCSFGPTIDFLSDLWPRVPIRIAQINPLLPRVSDDPATAIPYDALTAVIEAASPLPEPPPEAVDDVTLAIARTVAARIDDGAIIQAGLGKLPGAILRALKSHHHLRIHSGLIGDAVLDLLAAGAIERGVDVTAGVALGQRQLYDALPAAGIGFRSVAYTHDPRVLAGLEGFVTINAAVSVDLYGQAFGEVSGGRWLSGTGGATDFARGALAAGGMRIVALPSTAKGISRIVAPGAGAGPVSLSRSDIDIVVTEHGAADLRGLDVAGRAHALAGITHPDHREPLARAWRDGPGQF